MSEISINIPLSLLGDTKDFTPQGLLDGLQSVDEYKKKIEMLQAQKLEIIGHLDGCAAVLGNIIRADIEPFAKAQRLRQLSEDMNNLVKGVKSVDQHQ